MQKKSQKPRKVKRSKVVKAVLGIDPGFTAPGFCLIAEERRSPKVVAYEGGKFPIAKFEGEGDRLGALYKKVCNLLTDWKVDCIVMERPAVAVQGGSNAAIAAGQWIATIYLAAKNSMGMSDEDIWLVSPATWKKFMVNSGTASKVATSNRLIKEFDFEADTEGIADAACVGLLGYYLVNNLTTGVAYRDQIIQQTIKNRTTSVQGKAKRPRT